ncbi:hypothetical protein HY485_00300 [Candidatus Woesearchaeota archaeon]|nr:hypothetical protein [Candidatus Woesearchaeota archaeon]
MNKNQKNKKDKGINIHKATIAQTKALEKIINELLALPIKDIGVKRPEEWLRNANGSYSRCSYSEDMCLRTYIFRTQKYIAELEGKEVGVFGWLDANGTYRGNVLTIRKPLKKYNYFKGHELKAIKPPVNAIFFDNPRTIVGLEQQMKYHNPGPSEADNALRRLYNVITSKVEKYENRIREEAERAIEKINSDKFD